MFPTDRCYKDYEFVRKIGEGTFAEVFELEGKDGTRFALKRSKPRDDGPLERTCKEVAVLAELDHLHIIRYHECLIDDSRRICIIMEYCDFDLARAFEDDELTCKKIKPLALEIYGQIVCGLQYLHEKKVVHRDLKPANILLCEDKDLLFIAKIADFGLARYQDPELTREVGSPLYRAPEQLSRNYNHLADLYASGLVLFELLAREKHYNGHRGDWNGVLLGLRVPEVTKHVLNEFRQSLQGMEDLLVRLLDHQLEKRPQTAEAILEELAKPKRDQDGKLW